MSFRGLIGKIEAFSFVDLAEPLRVNHFVHSPAGQDPSETELAIASSILNLQARYDALTMTIELLFLGHGVTQDAFRANLETLNDPCLEKRLERIEGQSPRLAALSGSEIDLLDIDQTILDGLRFEDETGAG